MPPKQPRKGAKGTAGAKERKRRVVAAGVAAGADRDVIAAAAGCSTRHVNELASEPATRFLIEEILQPHRKQLTRLAGRAIRAVERAMVAQVNTRADHPVQLRAVGRWGQLVQLAQGGAIDKPLPAPSTSVTWEEYTVMYRKYQQRTANAGAAPSADVGDRARETALLRSLP